MWIESLFDQKVVNTIILVLESVWAMDKNIQLMEPSLITIML